jgi:hypothetical protein
LHYCFTSATIFCCCRNCRSCSLCLLLCPACLQLLLKLPQPLLVQLLCLVLCFLLFYKGQAAFLVCPALAHLIAAPARLHDDSHSAAAAATAAMMSTSTYNTLKLLNTHGWLRQQGSSDDDDAATGAADDVLLIALHRQPVCASVKSGSAQLCVKP